MHVAEHELPELAVAIFHIFCCKQICTYAPEQLRDVLCCRICEHLVLGVEFPLAVCWLP